jgi:hypothetical protein
MEHDATGTRHFFNANQRLQRAKQNGTCLAFPFTGNIQAIVIAVYEIDVGISGRPEEDGSAGGVAGGGMGRGIALSEVGLDLYDAGRKIVLSRAAHQNLAQQFARYPSRIASEEGALERTGLGVCGYSFCLKTGGRHKSYAAPFADSFK